MSLPVRKGIDFRTEDVRHAIDSLILDYASFALARQ